MKKKTILNYIYNTLYQLVTILLPLVTAPYISRVLGPERGGEYAYTYSIAGYFVLFILLGLNNYGNRACAQTQNDIDNLSKVFWNIYFLQLVRGVIALTIYIIYALNFARYPSLALAQGIYVISATLDIGWFFCGIEKFKLQAVRGSIIKILSVIATFLFVKKESDLIIYIVIIGLSFLLNYIVLWIFVKNEVHFVLPSIRECKKHIIPQFTLFIPVIAVSLYKIMDKIMLGYMSDMFQTGYYEYSEKIINIPMGIITSLGTIMLPRMSNMVSEGEQEKSNNLIYKSMIFILCLSAAMAFGIAAIASPFVVLFYGDDFASCGSIIKILTPTILFISWANVIRTQYLLPHGMDREYTFTVLGGALVNLIVNYFAIPIAGAQGAAIGTIIAEFFVAVWQTMYVRKKLPIKKYCVEGIPFLFAGMVMLTGVTLTAHYLSDIRWGNVILQIVLGAVIYISIVLVYLRNSKNKWLLTTIFEVLKKRNRTK